MPWAMEITEYVNAHSSLKVSLWNVDFGMPIGTLRWTARLESQVELAAATAPLSVDSKYLDLLEAAGDLVAGPGQDAIGDIIYGSPGDPPPIGAVATVTVATAMVDQMAQALGWAVEIAQHVEGVMDSPSLVGTDRYGQMGQITWIGVQQDLAAAEVARGKMTADSSYLGRLAATKDLFIPGSGHVTQGTRIA
jgi:hypothetical protein